MNFWLVRQRRRPRPAPSLCQVDAHTLLTVSLTVLARPGLWATALRQIGRLAPRRWWARPPFLPVPPRRYVRFRMVTAYGGDGSASAAAVAKDVVAYLEWCRSFRSGPEMERNTAPGARS